MAFGRNADWDLLQLISKGTGATATRVYDDNEMDVQLEELFSRVSSAAVTGTTLCYPLRFLVQTAENPAKQNQNFFIAIDPGACFLYQAWTCSTARWRARSA